MDMLALSWLLLGALIGFAAASKRGWSPVAGVLGGALLGILAPVLFLVSGVSKGDKTKVCPKCAERVKFAATVCRFCGAQFADQEAAAWSDSGRASLSNRLEVVSAPPSRTMSMWKVECVDRTSGATSVESVVSHDEREAFKIIADRGKAVTRVVSVKKLGK